MPLPRHKRITTAGQLADMLAKVPRDAALLWSHDGLLQWLDTVNDVFPANAYTTPDGKYDGPPVLYSKTRGSKYANAVVICTRP